MGSKLGWAIGVLVVIALLLRVGLAQRDLEVLDNLFVPDDTYYTLSIARSLAEGDAPSANRWHPTNGFQPLIAFLLIPAFALTEDPDIPLRFDLDLLALIDALNVLWIAIFARRLAGHVAALAAAAAWAFSPVAVANALGGLESPLAILMTLLLLETWSRARERDRTSDAVMAGVFAGLALLARIDTAFLIGSLGLLEFFVGRRRTVLRIASTATVVVAPWWIYCAVAFGTIVPESGVGVREQVLIHQATHLSFLEQWGWSIGTLIGPPFVTPGVWRHYLFSYGWGAVLLGVPLLAALGWWGAKVARRAEASVRLPWAALILSSGLLFLFYACYLPALWFFVRYFASIYLCMALVFATWVAWAWQHRATHRWVSPAVVTLYAGATLIGLASCLTWFFVNPRSTVDFGMDGAKGYRAVARDILEQVDRNMIVGAFQSGALAYYAGEEVRVVNLDGVVFGAAHLATKEKRLDQLARSLGVTHLADWEFNLRAFERASNPGTRPEFRTVGEARPQGNDRMQLVELVWPDGGG
jgi:hypothetical protein